MHRRRTFRTSRRSIQSPRNWDLKRFVLVLRADCFGVPFYAGWGATVDHIKGERRKEKRTVVDIFSAAYLHYSHYINPLTGGRGTINDVIEHLTRQRCSAVDNDFRFVLFGFSRWKHKHVLPFFRSFDPNNVLFADTAKEAIKAGVLKIGLPVKVVTWGYRGSMEAKKLADQLHTNVCRMEDGFVRSFGLGSDFIAPRSLVLDKGGLYFDPATNSDVVRMLNDGISVTSDMTARAFSLINLIQSYGITKYNVDPEASLGIKPADGQRVIFVPGQVESDASLTAGSPKFKSNYDLLAAVRSANPGAYIIYKEHPDVVAGNRGSESACERLSQLCDYIEVRASVLSCIDASHEVHTMTSLSGFDALLRGKHVVTYGIPFYSGWGLTQDMLGIPNRQRCCTLTELVIASLILYPRYWDHESESFVECETAVQRIIHQKLQGVPVEKRKAQTVRLRQVGRAVKYLREVTAAL